MTGLQCAICLHVEFVCAEAEKPMIGTVQPAATMIAGTAVCKLHIEDYDRAHNVWLLKIACRIVGVRPPFHGWGI